ncbi:hypothetical protein TARUN_209 [Trichoderma arundinaceum]|uniref:Uncharacterized protein n=1 Tax=Trichoderma arundinaceum TaxID=490622 RepID=A0A395P0Z6_TRIAR|nr:hypothetical protein TARUN_209 [Trichoderma arundinaceum]
MFRPSLWTLLAAAADISLVLASPCVSFDSNFNLLVFGTSNKDYSAGKLSNWSNGNAVTDITSSNGRPPFNGANTTCYLAQYFNAIYFLNADDSQPDVVHIYNADNRAWSTNQITVPDGFDSTSVNAILDHDTNVFYGLSEGKLYFMRMDELVTATSTPVFWERTTDPNFDVSHYSPVMGLAKNHIHFIDVDQTPGLARIFVIHYAYWQPEIQPYAAANNKGTFPQTYGHIFSVPNNENVDQKEFAFFPQDSRATYVINVDRNTTQVLAAPPAKDAKALYAASPSSLVQLGSAGDLSFLPYNTNNVAGNTQATWKKIGSIPAWS